MKYLSAALLVFSALFAVACGNTQPTNGMPTGNANTVVTPGIGDPNATPVADPNAGNPNATNPNASNPNNANPNVTNALNGNVLGSPMMVSNAAYATHVDGPSKISYQVFLSDAPLCAALNSNQPYSGRVVTFLLDPNGAVALDGNYLIDNNQPFVAGQTGTLSGVASHFTSGQIDNGSAPTGDGVVHIGAMDPNMQGPATGSFNLPIEAPGNSNITGTFNAQPCPALKNSDTF